MACSHSFTTGGPTGLAGTSLLAPDIAGALRIFTCAGGVRRRDMGGGWAANHGGISSGSNDVDEWWLMMVIPGDS